MFARNRCFTCIRAAFGAVICLLAIVAGMLLWQMVDDPKETPPQFAVTSLESSPGTAPSTPGLPEGVDADWWARTSEDLLAREYYVSETAEGLQAPNRRQGLRTVFQLGGIDVQPRSSAEANWKWSWRLDAWGRGKQALGNPTAVPTFEKTRIEYARGDLTEWYENRADGVEQGFIIAQAPAGEGEIWIEGRIETPLEPHFDSNAEAIDYRDDSGTAVLRYDKLVAWDATGRELTAEMTLRNDRIRLSVDAADALYPVTIDPLVTTPTTSAFGEKFDAALGYTVATAGDVNGDGYSDVVVGSPNFSTTGYWITGKAWVYYGSPTGMETTPAWEDLGDGDEAEFGYAVSTAGDVNGDGYDDILIGSPGWEDDTDPQGKAYIYFGSATGPSEDPDWDDNEGFAYSAMFGYSVSTAGDVNGDGYDDIVVGDPYAGGYGRVSVWHGSASGPGYFSDWHSTGFSMSYFRFGTSVSTAGDVNGDGYSDIVVGTPSYVFGGSGGGAIEVWHGSATGLAEDADTFIHAGIDYLKMGQKVSLAGDVNGDGYSDVLVQCAAWSEYTDEPPQLRLYAGSATGLETDFAWRVRDDHYGKYIGTAGDVNGDGYADLVVGSSSSENTLTGEGRIEVFFGNYSWPDTLPDWTVYGRQEDGYLGSCATAGDVNGDGYSDVVGGAPGWDDFSHENGAVFCWHGGSEAPKADPGWVVESGQDYARFGWSLAGCGDVNGDGYDDLLVGAPFYDYGQTNEGAVFLYLGWHQGLTWIPIWWADSDQPSSMFGSSVAGAGDVNGDGLPDILVGAYNYEQSPGYGGGAFLWHSVLGSAPYGKPSNADWQYHTSQANADLGFSVASAGDVNGDGYSDVIIGAPDYDNGTEDEGGAFVFHGSVGGLSEDYDWFHDTAKADCSYGYSVACAGDMNGDGYSDVIIGAPTYDHPAESEGMVYVYIGSADGIQPGAPWWWMDADQVGAHFGYSVSSAGDMNGDGYGDVVIGAPDWDTSATNCGGAFVWFGGATPPDTESPASADWDGYWLTDGSNFGASVARAGDVNNDGYGDIIIGCPYYDGSGGPSSGFALVMQGAPSASDFSLGWIDDGKDDYCNFGRCVAWAGDVNGDGFSDLAIGADYYNAGQPGEGRAFVYYGGGSRGKARSARQWHRDLATRLAPLGRANSTVAFGLSGWGRTAAGRGTVQMVCETKPYGTGFTGSGLLTGPWADTGAPSGSAGSQVELSQEITGLASATAYTWRTRLRSRNPFFPGSPWVTSSWNGATEHDFRTTGGPTPVDDSVPGVALQNFGNHPNPFNPSTTFQYSLTRKGTVRLNLYDLQGRLVRSLINEVQDIGPKQARWDGRDDSGRTAATGVYLARLQTEHEEKHIKVMLLK